VNTRSRNYRLLVGLLVGSVALNIALAIAWLWDIEPSGQLRHAQLGDIGTWVGGLGAGFAVLVAVVTLLKQNQVWQSDRFKGVSAWLYYVTHGETSIIEGLPPGFSGLYLAIQNATSNPVFKVVVRVSLPGHDPVHYTESVWPPGKTRALALAEAEGRWKGVPVEEVPARASVTLTVTDELGSRWRIATGERWRQIEPADETE
jgi:hypothetical protein